MQKVSDPKGKEVQQGTEKIQIKRPNLFRIENKTPYKKLGLFLMEKRYGSMISFVEQVTATG